MPIKEQPEPAGFASKVGKRGAAALANGKLAVPVPSWFWKGKDHWRDALDELHSSYDGVCAFSSTYIERVTGSPSIEHFRPKSKYPREAYQWSNFRLICARMNSRKREHEDVLDPFTIPDNTFDLNPLTGEVLVHAACPKSLKRRAETTISRLKLSDGHCCKLRRTQVQNILLGHWSESEAQRQCPFVYRCLERQHLI